jgi:hypothetical protein
MGIPFIYISTFSDPDNLRKALELNPDYIFKKPVSILAIYRAVEKILSIN